MSEQEVIELREAVHREMKKVYFAGFRHGFAAAMTAAVVYYFFI